MPNIIRRLGAGETWLALLHDKAAGTAQVALLATIKGAIDEQLFQQALHCLFQHYPQLSYRLSLTQIGYFLTDGVPFERIPISYDKYQNENDWQAVMQKEADTILPQDQYLWRVRLLSPIAESNHVHHIIVTIHHSICDGLSLAALVDALLYYLQNNTTPITPHHFPNAIEMLYRNTNTSQELGDLKEKIAQLDTMERYQWPHQKLMAIEKRETHFMFGFLDNTKVNGLHQAAKQHQVSINAMLNAALLLSAQQLLKRAFNAGLSTPVNLRPYTQDQLSAEDIVFSCGVINTVHPAVSETTDFWQLAKEYQQQLMDRFHLLRLTADYDFNELKQSMAMIWEARRSFFCYDFMVTNLGMLHFPHQSIDFQLQALRFATCRKGGDNNMMLLINSTSSGMFYTWGYTYPLISDAWAQQFAANFTDIIANYF